MSTGATIVGMTPIEPGFYWKCQRSACRHRWPCKDPKKPPKRCAKCKRLDWNRETLPIGRPRKGGKRRIAKRRK